MDSLTINLIKSIKYLLILLDNIKPNHAVLPDSMLPANIVFDAQNLLIGTPLLRNVLHAILMSLGILSLTLVIAAQLQDQFKEENAYVLSQRPNGTPLTKFVTVLQTLMVLIVKPAQLQDFGI